MYSAYKFRMYPNDEQKQLINKTFGSSRFVYNYYLEKSQNNNYKGAYSNIRDYTDNLKYKYPFLQEIDSIVIRKSLFNLDDAFKRFYNKDALYPKFKSKYGKNSYNTNAVYRNYKDLNKRMYECKKCGSTLDRDLNASINIMWEGLKIHYSRKLNVISG